MTKTKPLSCLGLLVLLAIPVYAADPAAPAAPEPTPGQLAQVPDAPVPILPALSPNAVAVVKLSGAKVGEEVVLAYIKNCQSPFNLSADAVLHLKQSGITSPVITAMLAHDGLLRNQNPSAYGQTFSTPAEPPPVAPGPVQAASQPRIVTPPLVPPARAAPSAPVEVVTVSPGPDYYWTPGYWGWNGGWVWIGGGWGLHTGYGYYGHGGWGGSRGGFGHRR